MAFHFLSEVLCDPDTEFRCVGYETRCLNVTDLCGEVPLCSDGSDLSYAHAGCDNDGELSGQNFQIVSRHGTEIHGAPFY